MSCFNSLVYTNGFKTHTLLFGGGTGLVWHICALESRPQTEKVPNMASLYFTWGHPAAGWVACTQCRNSLTDRFTQMDWQCGQACVVCNRHRQTGTKHTGRGHTISGGWTSGRANVAGSTEDPPNRQSLVPKLAAGTDQRLVDCSQRDQCRGGTPHGVSGQRHPNPSRS